MIFARDLASPEAPVLLPDGSWLLVEMAPDRGWVCQIGRDGQTKRVIAKTGRPNGLAVDRHGVIWVAESKTPALLRLTLDGKVDVVLTGDGAEPFLFPNDLAIGPDGALYMTDSGIRRSDFAPGGAIRPDYQTAPYDGRVYRIDLAAGRVTRIDSGLRFANGIAFDAAGNLYANETMTGMVYRYRPAGGGAFGPRQDFGNVVDPDAPAGYKGPDGMKLGLDGNLYVTVYGQRDVTVLSPDGAVVRRIRLHGARPTNLAFGPKGERRIYVTEVELGNLEVHEVDADGLPLFG